MVSLGFGMLPFVVLLVFPTSTTQSCVESTPFGKDIVRSGYATCHYSSYEEHGLLYITGFKRKMGSNDDLRGIEKAKCCQPPEIHMSKPHTCTSADWDLSFSRYVFQSTLLIPAYYMKFLCHAISPIFGSHV